MRKITVLFLVLLFLCGCQKQFPTGGEIKRADLETTTVDMSGYDGMNSLNHHFAGISALDFIEVMNEKASGIFYFSSTNCEHCQNMTKYVEEAADKTDSTVYYINVESLYELTQDEFNDLYDKLDPILAEVADGLKGLQTPHFIIVINGEYANSYIGDVDGTHSQIVETYESAMNRLK